jgi:long-chain acyl-CoA synthetase
MDKIVFKKISEGTGGRLRAAISGGAPVAAQTQEFLSMVLCPLIQGYGMTECCGMMTCQLTSHIGTYASVGGPSTAAEIKLVACNDYDPNPAPGSGIPPRGELWVRGGIVMEGYYKQPQTTRENLTQDGWLMSGDIAEIDPNGAIKIIDRKKNLVKLAHGEYVALEKLEAQYKTSSFVANMCIHADSLQSHIIALVVCDPKELATLQEELGLDSSDLNNQKLRDRIQNDFLACARDAEFKGAQVLKTFAIVDDEWTAENGMLTAAQKVIVFTYVIRLSERIS